MSTRLLKAHGNLWLSMAGSALRPSAAVISRREDSIIMDCTNPYLSENRLWSSIPFSCDVHLIVSRLVRVLSGAPNFYGTVRR